MICLLINVLILGEILNLVLVIYKDDTENQDFLDSTNSLMTNNNFDGNLQDDIQLFMNET